MRREHAIAYDAVRRSTVLFGGRIDRGGSAADTWEWNGSGWLQLAPRNSPAARGNHALAYDARHGRVVLFGGDTGYPSYTPLGDTWEYLRASAATYGTFGTGCPGSVGTPSLAPSAGRLPWLGEGFALRISRLPAGKPTYVYLGLSRTVWRSFRLPLDLRVIGMPNCLLYVSPDLTYPVTNTAGTALWNVRFPNDPGLVGVTFFNQAWVVDAAANPFGVSVSNAGEGRIGLR